MNRYIITFHYKKIDLFVSIIFILVFVNSW